MFRPRLSAAIFACGIMFVTAAAADDDPIDTALEACLDSPGGQSTQGMVECFGAAYEAWDAALNDAYRALIGSLAPAEADLLRAAQREWVKFRDAESAFLGSLVTPERGSIMRITVNAAMTDLVKDRVLQLRSLAGDDDGGN